MSDDDDKKDVTRIGGTAPVVPKLPGAGAPPAKDDATRHGVTPPVLPSQRPATGPPPAPTPSPAESEETIAIGQAVAQARFSLQRVEPPGHTGVVHLSGETYLAGRKQGADLPLFSPTASRDHARLERRADGWYLEPCAGKTVIANGSIVRGAVRLEHKMRLRLGGDELIFFDENAVLAAAAPARVPAASATRSAVRRRWIALAVALAAIALGLAWWVLASG